MKSFIPIFLIYLFIAGCTPQRKLNRLVARHPELIRVDSLHFKKIYPIPGKSARLSIPAERISEIPVILIDSVTGIKIEVLNTFRDPESDSSTFVISVYVPEDSISIDEKLPYKTIEIKERKKIDIFLENLPFIFIVVLVLIIFFNRRN